MSKKGLLGCFAVLCMAICALGFASCNQNSDGKDSQKSEIELVYEQYTISAKAAGETPLSYEEWLNTIKGEKGDPGVGIEKVELNADGDLVITFTDGSTQTVDMPASGTQTAPQGTEGLHYQRIVGEDAYRVIGLGLAAEYDIKIPATYKGLPVTEIGGEAFRESAGIISVEIPDSVMSIGEDAFANCFNLTSVVIGDSVTSIGSSAFSSCTNLTSIEIGGSVTSIGDYAFSWCDNLTSITVSENNTAYKSIDGNLYSKDGTTLVQYAIGKSETTFSIPSAVTSIGAYAFSYCANLKDMKIGDNIISIGNRAFYDCELTKIEISDNVSSIGDYAFMNCPIKTAKVPAHAIDHIGGRGNDWRCLSIESIEITSGDILGGVFYTGDALDFRYLTDIKISDSVTSIGMHAFAGTAYYQDEENWNNGLLYIDNHLIKAKDDFTGELIIKDGTICIAGGALLEENNTLTGVEIPNSVISIGDYAFSNCYGLREVVIPDSVISIGERAFSCNINFGVGTTKVVIGSGVKTIGEAAFAALETVYYKGTASDWENITISSYNDNLTSATRYYYVENQADVPTDGGNYWHYGANEEIVIW